MDSTWDVGGEEEGGGGGGVLHIYLHVYHVFI